MVTESDFPLAEEADALGCNSDAVPQSECETCPMLSECASASPTDAGTQSQPGRGVGFCRLAPARAAAPPDMTGDREDQLSAPRVNVPPAFRSAPATITPARRKALAERRALLKELVELADQGHRQAGCAILLQVSDAKLSRLLSMAGPIIPGRRTLAERARAVLALPDDQLCPEREYEKTEWDTLLDSEAVRQELQSLYLASMRASSEATTHGRYKGSMSLALQRLADFPGVPGHLATRLRLRCQPIALRRFLRGITPHLEQLIRGPKHFQNHGPTAQRECCVRLPDGSRANILAGFRWVMDDMSLNQPFWADRKDGGRVVETVMSRQGLYCMDVAAQRWLGVELIARPREAYRAEDILRFLRKLFELHGVPDEIVMEQGVWKARVLSGFARDAAGRTVEVKEERPEMSEEDQRNLTSGLQAIGVKVIYVHGAHLKLIEGGFGRLQPIIATFAREVQNIGAHAGENEAPANQLRRARADVRHPQLLKFHSIENAADAVLDAMGWDNKRPKVALNDLSPDDRWELDTRKRPLGTLKPNDLVVFLPEQRERTIRGGAIHFNAKITGHKFSFRNAEIMAALGDGYRVTVRFDGSAPGLGAAILNAEPTTSPRNRIADDPRRAYHPGQLICMAEFEAAGALEDVQSLPAGFTAESFSDWYGPEAEDIGDAVLRAQRGWHRTEGRYLPKPGQPAVRTSATRDGHGNAATRQDGGQPAATPAPAPRAERAKPAPAAESAESFAESLAAKRAKVRAFTEALEIVSG